MILYGLKGEEARKKMLEEAKQRAKVLEIMIGAYRSKSQDLKKQVEILQQVHARHIDRKNAAIATLHKDIEESEEQYATAVQAHLISIDTLIGLQDQRIETMRKQFESDVMVLDNEFNTERVRLQAQHAKEKTDILGIMARAEHEFQEVEADARHEYSSVKDDVKNKNLEEKHALRIQLEGTVEDLWRQFQSALNGYNASTDDRKRQFEELKTKDQKNAREIEQQMKKLENIAHLKTKLANSTKDFEEKNKALKEEKETIQTQFQDLKKKMNTFREKERQRLTELALLSNSVLKSLKAKVEHAELIIAIAEMNRKLETEEEKFEQQIVLEDLPPEFHGMHQFNKRYNKVYLGKLTLERQKAQLKEENDHLKSILKQYLDGITVSESVLSQLNPLVVVNGKTNAPIRHTGPLNVTYVEAAHCAQQLSLYS
ncbi:coiled-coil domain-containing protein 65-like protein [Gorgonomyces haynaldii]|nr:coiled-coil domain-containing protein 65-like protein [Gorgonomyces haynaldii]